jgi:hypothetical protein
MPKAQRLTLLIGDGVQVHGVLEWLKKQTQLESLKIHHNSSNGTAGLFSSLSSLRMLEFRCCRQMEELSPDVCSCRNLERLALVGCDKLTSLPDNIGSLSQLRYPDLVDCGSLSTVPESIGMLHLKGLDLHAATNALVRSQPHHLQLSWLTGKEPGC